MLRYLQQSQPEDYGDGYGVTYGTLSGGENNC